MTDRRRTNPPNGGTAPPIFLSAFTPTEALQSYRPKRTRQPNELRKIFLKTGLNSSASGSAYLELQPSPSQPPSTTTFFPPPPSSLKLACSIHGPHPLPRSQPYTPHLHLSTHIKFAPFASRTRRDYVRDADERDLAAHLETALRGVVIGERWPKSGVDVCITVLEGEDEVGNTLDGQGRGGDWAAMTVLAGCVTVASAAMVDAGIDCVDLAVGGVAAVVVDGDGDKKGKGREIDEASGQEGSVRMVLDPSPMEHERVVAAAMVAYLQSRDEITELWIKGDAGVEVEDLINGAVHAANASRTVLAEELREAGERKFGEAEKIGLAEDNTSTKTDVDMTG